MLTITWPHWALFGQVEILSATNMVRWLTPVPQGNSLATLVVRGARSPFVFIHDHDVVGAIVHGISSPVTGIFNVAGDGKLNIDEIAARMGKRCLVLPAGLLFAALWLLKRLHLTQYGPEQLDFLRYRPVLDNRRLKQEFGYVPKRTSAEAFELWRTAHAASAGIGATAP